IEIGGLGGVADEERVRAQAGLDGRFAFAAGGQGEDARQKTQDRPGRQASLPAVRFVLRRKPRQAGTPAATRKIAHAAQIASAAGGAAVLVGAPAVDDGTEVCAVSGKRYPRREMIQYEGKWISAEHRDAYFQRLREGVAQPGEGAVPGPFGYGGFWVRFAARFI